MLSDGQVIMMFPSAALDTPRNKGLNVYSDGKTGMAMHAVGSISIMAAAAEALLD
jgi:hypothetical protein